MNMILHKIDMNTRTMPFASYILDWKLVSAFVDFYVDSMLVLWLLLAYLF
jgi:hypothetical protein